MKKTAAQSQIKPQQKIKIPLKLSQSQYKAIRQNNFFNTLEEAPIITKKEILYEAMGLQFKSNKQKQQKSSKRVMRPQLTKKKELQSINVVKQFRAQTSDHKVRKSESVSHFKIKMSGAGFRQRGKSVSKLLSNKQSKQTAKITIDPLITSRQYFKSKIDDPSENLDVIKQYYSTRMKIEANQMQQLEPQITKFQYKSEKIQNKQKKNSPQKQVSDFGIYRHESIQIPQKINLYKKLVDSPIKKYLKYELDKQDFEIQQSGQCKQEHHFIKKGFGVNHDLSQYDIQSLNDIDGEFFLAKYNKRQMLCPYFQNQKYIWINVIVVGFDKQSNKALIRTDNQGKIKKVNRLSLKLKNDKQYWRRIAETKKIRTNIMEQKKYIGYLDSRPQFNDLLQFIQANSNTNNLNKAQLGQKKIQTEISWIPEDKLAIIQKQCHNRYYKHFLILEEMHRDFQPFSQLGIKFRTFTPFQQKNIYQKFLNFKECQQILQKQHYCSITNMASSLRIMIKKIRLETQQSFFNTIIKQNLCISLEQLAQKSKKIISQSVTKLIKNTRQVLISQIVYKTRFSFGAEERPVMKVAKKNDKKLEARYLKLNNYLFRQLIVKHYFVDNTEKLSNYLLMFTEWSAYRPRPIINLQIIINSQRKQIQTIPSKDECYNKIYSIYQHLQRCICKVPDLSNDLLYQKQKLIHVKLDPSINQVISKSLQYSFQQINKYIETNNKYLIYLTHIKFAKCKFQKQALNTYKQVLSSITGNLKQMLYYSLNEWALFKISLEPCKKLLNEGIINNKIRIMKLIQKQSIQQNANMLKQLQKMQNQLKIIPDDQVTYVRMKKYVTIDCQNLIQDCKDRYDLCGKFYELLEQFSFVYKIKQFDKYMESIAQISIMQGKLTTKKYELQQIQRKLIERINSERQQIQSVIQTSKQQIQTIIGFKRIQQYRDSFTSTSKLFYILQDSNKKLENINYREELLQQQLSIFPNLTRLLKKLQPYYQMWKYIYDYKIDSQDWYELPIQQLSHQDIKNKLFNVYKKQFGRLTKFFNDTKNTQAMMICEGGNSMVGQLQQKLWVIDSFTKQGLLKKPNMMSNILVQLYGVDAPKNFRNVNLHDLLDHKVLQNKQFIIETAQKAQKIWNLQKRVNSVIHQIKQLYFQIDQNNGIGHIENYLLEQMLMISKQQLQQMDVIKSQQQAIDILKKINNVYAKITTIQSTLMIIQRFQPKFGSLYRVFLISQIINDLSEDKRKINQVTRSWTGIIKHFNKDLQAWQAIDSDSHKNRLQNCMKILGQIEQSLKKYLHQKRKLFPRLFFINDEQLIQMIGKQRYEIKSIHLQLFFNGATKLLKTTSKDGKNTNVIGIQGTYKDRVGIKKSVNNNIIIWDRLKILHNEIVQSMQSQCSIYGIQNSKVLIVRVLYAILRWTFKIEQAMKKLQKQNSNNGNELIKLYEQYNREQVCKEMGVYNKEQIGQIHGWYCMRSVHIVLADILKQVSYSKQAITSTSFEWLKHWRVYSKSDKLSSRIMSIQLGLSYEYVGVGMTDIVHMLASPLSNIHTVLTYMRMHAGINVVNSGDIRQTLRSLSAMALCHYVVQHNSHGQESGQSGVGKLVDQLRGYYSQPVLGCLCSRQGMGVQMMSVLAVSAYQIRRAILTKQYAQVLGIQTRWDHSRGILNNALHLQMGWANGRGGDNNNSMMTLRMWYRDISMKTMPWSVLIRYYILSMHTSPHNTTNNIHEQLKIVLRCMQQCMADGQCGLANSYKMILHDILKQHIVNYQQYTNRHISIAQQLTDKIQQYLPAPISYSFKDHIKRYTQQYKQIQQQQQQQQYIQHRQQQYVQVQIQAQIRQFAQVLAHAQQFNTSICEIAVVGPSNSGKSQLIQSALSYKQIQSHHIHWNTNIHAYNHNYNNYNNDNNNNNNNNNYSDSNRDREYIILQQLYCSNSYSHVHLLSQQQYSCMPILTTIIYECASLQHVGPSALTIYNKKLINNWHKVMWKLLKSDLKQHSTLVQQMSRQMGIFFRTLFYRLLGLSAQYHISQYWMWEQHTQHKQHKNNNNNTQCKYNNNSNIVQQIWQIQQILIRIVTNSVKMAISFIKQSLINENELTTIRQMLFIGIAWVAKSDIYHFISIAKNRHKLHKRCTIGNNTLIDVDTSTEQIVNMFWHIYMSNIQSTLLIKNTTPSSTDSSSNADMIVKYKQSVCPYNYCYDMEKKAWLQWNVLDSISHYFSHSYAQPSLQLIYLPTKQTASALFLASTVSKHYDYCILATTRGSGASTLVRRVMAYKYRSKNKNKNITTQLVSNILGSKDNTRTKTEPAQTPTPITINQYYSICTLSPSSIAKMVDKTYVSKSKDGAYNPYKNGHVNILIDDMDLLLQNKQQQQQQQYSSIMGNKQILIYLSLLTVFKTQERSNKKLNNSRLIYCGSGIDQYKWNSNLCMDRIMNNVIPIQMRSPTHQSISAIFNYVLQWFFGNTDNPFSKQVRSMQQLLVNISVILSKQYLHIMAQQNQLHHIQPIFVKYRYGHTNIKTLMSVFNYICRVNPKQVKKQQDILQTWAYQFKHAYPKLTWINYLSAFQKLGTLMAHIPIDNKLFRNSITTVIHAQDSHQSVYYIKQKTSQQYTFYTFKDAQIKLITYLLEYSKQVKYHKFISQLIFYPQFIKQLIFDMRLFVSTQTHMLKVTLPYQGTKTTIRCAKLIVEGNYQMGIIKQPNKNDWKKQIYSFLSKKFKQFISTSYAQQNTKDKKLRKSTKNEAKKQIMKNYEGLVFYVNQNSNNNEYFQVLSQYLSKCESKKLAYSERQDQKRKIESQQVSQPTNLLQSLGISSVYSQKYNKFVQSCQAWLKIVVIIDRKVFKFIAQKIPILIKHCTIIQTHQIGYRIQSIVNRSLGVLWSNLDIISFVQKTNESQIETQHNQEIIKKITQIQNTILSKHISQMGRKQKIIQWMKLTSNYYKIAKNKLDKRVEQIKAVLKKKSNVIQQKQKQERDLGFMLPKLAKVKTKNQEILAEVSQQNGIYKEKKRIYDEYFEVVQQKRAKTVELRRQCEAEMDKVLPMLQSAEQSLQKVTRDDINQLRSFPNPPLPAAKVVQALCFVFNEDHLVKQKVENGVKFKDYWDYAKKFILNDRLLKRVTEFKPQYIKTLNKAKMQILKVIIKQQQFKQQRVFKASSAAGNLSVWMRAVVLAFQVMEVIDPKRKILNQALQALRVAEQIFAGMKAEMDAALEQLNKRQQRYDQQMGKQRQLQQKIDHLKYVIKRGQQFIELLQRMEVKWIKQIEVVVPARMETLKQQCILLAVHIIYLCKMDYANRKQVKDKIEKLMGTNKKFVMLQNQITRDYFSILLRNQNKNKGQQQHVQVPQTKIQQVEQKQNKKIVTQKSQNSHMQNNSKSSKIKLNTQQSKSSKQKQPTQSIQKQITQQQQQIKQYRYNIMSQFYAQNTICLIQQLENSNKNLILLDQTQTYIEIIKDSIQSILINHNAYTVIDSLQLDDCKQIYVKIANIVNKYKEQIKQRQQYVQNNQSNLEDGKQMKLLLPPLIIVKNVQQFNQAQCRQMIKFCGMQSQYYRIVVVMHQKPNFMCNHQTSNNNQTDRNQQDQTRGHKYKHQGDIQLNINNQLCTQTKQAIFQSILCPINKHTSALHCQQEKHMHSQLVNYLHDDLIFRFLGCQNIILDDANITQWTHNYYQFWDLMATSIKIKQNTQIQKQVIHTLADSHYWSFFINFAEFAKIVQKQLQTSQNQSIYTLNQRVKDKFDIDKKPKNNTINKKKVNKQTKQDNQLSQKQSQMVVVQQQELIPFSAINFIELQLCIANKQNLINQVLQKLKHERSTSKTIVNLSNSQHILYYPSNEKAIENLQYLTENQKQLLICCQYRFQAYRLYHKIKQYYDRFCRKMQETDDDFTPEKFGFRAHIIVTNENRIKRRRQWKVSIYNKASNKTNHAYNKNNQQILKQFNNVASSLTKAQKNYCQNLITKAEQQINKLSFKQFRDCVVKQKNDIFSYQQWEKKQYQ